MRLILVLLIMVLSRGAGANVLPCRGETARAFDDDPASVRYAAEGGRVLFGAAFGGPIGLALAVVGVPIGAVTGPLWIQQDQAVAEGALWGFCPGLLAFGAFTDLGYYLIGGPVHGISRVIGGDEHSHANASSAGPSDAAKGRPQN